ncbi:hypothetical protein BU16DRAFT_584697 [Lophium mytilinum]|uniref:Mediator of RNA polymerase II transcription subunit 6 n=1 Tax=Lophium mytilinum TaxID=390894 RepID=A0A6A6QID3_9PEZI|nr:hypothetical protein BU16DRAFT_584697 [Lophium mytilinum]
MAQKDPPLDETAWFSEDYARFYGGINTNTVHVYFYHSTFFDLASLNGTLWSQANRHYDQQHLLESRKAFEDAVKGVQSGGTQFLIVGEPESEDGTWVMQKQLRTVQRGLPDTIEVLGTYFIIGIQIFMAPSVGDVLAAKTLNITNQMSSFFTLASSLSLFTPATGHTYFHPSLKPSTDAKKLAIAGGVSRATTPGLNPTQDTASVAQTATGVAATSSAIGGTFIEPLFLQSLSLSTRYATEYADENPLQGEPGAFVFSSTNERVAALNEAAAQAALKAQSAAVAVVSAQQRERESAVSTAAPTPKPAVGEGSGSGRKGSKGGTDPTRVRRRKSKGLASPITPKEGTGQALK